MAKSKPLEMPNTPEYKMDPIFQAGYQGLSDFGNQLIRGDYSQFGGLGEATSLNPQTSRLALQQAQGALQPQYDQSVLDIRNEAAANNQLQSSTFTNALAKNAHNLNTQYQGIVSGAALQDQNRALQNRMSLFGQGLNTLGQATTFGLQNQEDENMFNLQNYDNLVAKAIQDNQNANKANGWQQALGFFSPLGHDYLNSQGINSVPGYGVADIAKMASLFVPGNGGLGGGLGGGVSQSARFPGQYASN